MIDFGLTDAELFPLLDERGRESLRRLREHPNAPRYNWTTGERLTAEGLANVRAYAQRVNAERVPWPAGEPPAWVSSFVEMCRRDVPFYRQREPWPGDNFLAIPLTRRDDIRREAWSFVPDGQNVESLITYTTSGTTGTRLHIPATPELPARYLPLFERALSRVGVRLEGGARTSIIHVCAQRGTVVLCSISSYLGGAAFAKINLDASDWTDPADAARFIDDCSPEMFTGDPFALGRLMRVPLKTRSKAIISAGTALANGLRAKLTRHFGCPVIDLYSTNESGPISFSVEDAVHEILPPDLYLEILDETGQPCPHGVLGEIVLTGGLNVCLPLVRYATGDFASLDSTSAATPCLRGLNGRPPIAFRDSGGNWFSSIDVSTALSQLNLSTVAVHQSADGSVKMRWAGDESATEQACSILADLFKVSRAEIEIIEEGVPSGKVISYTTDLVALPEI